MSYVRTSLGMPANRPNPTKTPTGKPPLTNQCAPKRILSRAKLPIDFTFGATVGNYQPSIANRYPVLDQKLRSLNWRWRYPILRRYIGGEVRNVLRKFRTGTRPVTWRRHVSRVGLSGRVRTATPADSSARATRDWENASPKKYSVAQTADGRPHVIATCDNSRGAPRMRGQGG